MAALLLPAAGATRRHVLGTRTDLGRSPECDVVLADATVSRRHATIERGETGYLLRDLGSRYGSKVNGRTCADQMKLTHGDEILLGSVALTFEEQLSPELEKALARVARLERTSRALVNLLDVAMRDFSPDLLLKSSGPALVMALRAERCAILIPEPSGGNAIPVFSHRLTDAELWQSESIPAVLASGRAQERPLPDGTLEVVHPLRGSEQTPHGVVLLHVPSGREFDADDRELLSSMCTQIGTAISTLRLAGRLRREERIRGDLARYVSDQVADAIVAGRLALNLGGEARRVSVVFVDVRGFTTLAEQLQPKEVLEILNDHFSEASAIVKSSLGTVDKYIGDALMAVFGAPNVVPDQAIRAVKAAVEIRRAAGELRSRWATRPWAARIDPARFAVGIGVNTGDAVAGNLGSNERKEYTVIGDAVNVASRLCSAAAPGQILIGPETARELHGLVALESLGPRPVKGRAEPVETWSVLE